MMTLQEFFKEFNLINISAFAQLCGINPSLMRKYAVGIEIPSTKQLTKIQQGLDLLIKNLSNVTIKQNGNKN